MFSQVNENKSIPPIVFLGNKKDLIDLDPDARMVSHLDINGIMGECEKAVARTEAVGEGDVKIEKNWNILHYETSALTGEKIDNIFDNIIREIRARRTPTKMTRKKGSWCFLL